MSKLRALRRFIQFAFYTIWYTLGIIRVAKKYPDDRSKRAAYKSQWAYKMFDVLGIEVFWKGKIEDKGYLIATNHRSYLDIALIVAQSGGSYVAKEEVKKWPVIGQATNAGDAVWVKRESKGSRRNTREVISKALQSGHPVIVHPEGTTFRGPGVKEFKPGVFMTCAEFNIPVLPVAIEYHNPEVAWVDDDTFYPHFFKIFSRKKIFASFHVGPEIQSTDPEKLLNDTRNWIHEETLKIRAEVEAGLLPR